MLALFVAIIGLVATLLICSLWSFIPAVIRSWGLSPEARSQYFHWRTLYNNNFSPSKGETYECKLFKARELAVYFTDHPIVPFRTSAPLICTEGYLEEKSAEQLDEIISSLRSMPKKQRSEMINDRRRVELDALRRRHERAQLRADEMDKAIKEGRLDEKALTDFVEKLTGRK